MPDPHFFDGGQLPEDFNEVSSGDMPEQDPKEPEERHLRYNPPELVPTPGGSQTSDIAREEIDTSPPNSVEKARERMERDETEIGEPVISETFQRAGWTSQEIEEVAQEDRERGNSDGMEWDEQVQREYARWSIDEAQRQYDERWGDQELIEQAEEYQRALMEHYGDHSPDRDIDIEH